MVSGPGAEETGKMVDTCSDEDWDSEIELEEVEESDVNDGQRTEGENSLKDCNGNLSVKDNNSEEESDGEVVIEEVKDFHEGKIAYIQCKFCTRQIPTEKYPRHLEQVHGKDPEALKVTCRYCKEKVLSIKQHRKLCSKATKQCPHCGANFWKTWGLKEHIRHCHTVRTPNLNCHLCNSAFFCANHLKRHLRTHDPRNYQNCQFCTKKCTKEKILYHEQWCKEWQMKTKGKCQQREERCQKGKNKETNLKENKIMKAERCKELNEKSLEEKAKNKRRCQEWKTIKEKKTQEIKIMKEARRQEMKIMKEARRQEMKTYKECRHCSKTVIMYKLLQHEERCLKSKLQASCRMCFELIKWCDYSKHLKDVHNTAVKRQRCSTCKRSFHPDLGLKDHEKMCKRGYEEERRLVREDSGKGEEMEEEREQCDYCDKTIRGKEEMEEHKVMCWEEVYGRRGMAD